VSAPQGGQDGAARVQRLAGELSELEVDALLVENLIDLRYLTGFTGSNGMALVFAAGHADAGAVGEVHNAGGATGVGQHRCFSDFRYATHSGGRRRSLSGGPDEPAHGADRRLLTAVASLAGRHARGYRTHAQEQPGGQRQRPGRKDARLHVGGDVFG